MSISRALTMVPRRAMASQVPATKAETATPYNQRPDRKDKYLNPLLTPPPRSPRTPEDFRHPERLGHWKPFGFDFTDPVKDKYMAHEAIFIFVTVSMISIWVWTYSPDLKLVEWARREAFFRVAKREALGQPLIDRNVVDPDRIVLPTEEELGDFPVKF